METGFFGWVIMFGFLGIKWYNGNMEGVIKIGFNILDRIAANNIGASILAYINDLTAGEVRFLTIAAAILILWLVWRWFGFVMVLVMLLVYFLAYILFINNTFDFYKDYQTKNIQHMQTIEEELEKQ